MYQFEIGDKVKYKLSAWEESRRHDQTVRTTRQGVVVEVYPRDILVKWDGGAIMGFSDEYCCYSPDRLELAELNIQVN